MDPGKIWTEEEKERRRSLIKTPSDLLIFYADFGPIGSSTYHMRWSTAAYLIVQAADGWWYYFRYDHRPEAGATDLVLEQATDRAGDYLRTTAERHRQKGTTLKDVEELNLPSLEGR